MNLNSQLRIYLNALKIPCFQFKNAGNQERFAQKLPFEISQKEEAIIYDCFSPLLSSYLHKIETIDENIVKICGKIAKVENEIREEISEQQKIKGEILQIFEEFESKKQLFEEIQGAENLKDENGFGDLEKVEDWIKMCPVDSGTIIELKSKLAFIESDNNDLRKQIEILEEETEDLKTILSSKQKPEIPENIESENDLKIKQQKYEDQILMLENELKNLEIENQKNEVQLLILQQKVQEKTIEKNEVEENYLKNENELNFSILKENERQEKYKSRIRQLENEEQKVEIEISNKKQELAVFESQIGEIEQTIANRVSELNNLEIEQTEMLSELKKLETENKMLTQKSVEFSSKMAENE